MLPIKFVPPVSFLSAKMQAPIFRVCSYLPTLWKHLCQSTRLLMLISLAVGLYPEGVWAQSAGEQTISYPGDSGSTTTAETKFSGLVNYVTTIAGWILLLAAPIAAIWAALAGQYKMMWGLIIGTCLLFLFKFFFSGLHSFTAS